MLPPNLYWHLGFLNWSCKVATYELLISVNVVHFVPVKVDYLGSF